MTLSEWLDYIGSIHISAIDLGLERIYPIASDLGLTRFSCPVITVGGTNGKGSTICALETIYQSAGYSVAAYISPHITDFKERLRFNGKMLDDSAWCEAFRVIETKRGKVSLSFFEFTTLAALLICQNLKIDVLLLEVGLGGRLDAVNVVENDVAVLTSVDLDHMHWLGDTREKIAYEKTHIVRKQLVCGDLHPPAVVQRLCLEKTAAYYQITRDFHFVAGEKDWSFYGPRTQYIELPRPNLLLTNLACALMVVELLQSTLPVLKGAVFSAMQRASLPGRFETVHRNPAVILDVAHNPQAAHMLAARLAARDGKKVRTVFAVLEDKAASEMAAIMSEYVDCWYLAGLDSVARGLSAHELAKKLATVGIKNGYNFRTVSEALAQVMEDTEPTETIVVWGSFHTVAQAKEWLKEDCHERTV